MKRDYLMQGRKLYVGGLSYGSTEGSLRGLFEQTGAVDSVRIITDRDTGQSKGFGFVEMGTSGEAEAAMTACHGREFEGRTLSVNEAKPQAPRTSQGSRF